MKGRILLACVVLVVAGCQAKPVTTTRYHNPPAAAPHDYLARRTAELQAMGGPFKDKDVARQKAAEDYENLYGSESQATTTTTWGTDREAERVAAQSEVNEYFNQQGREK